MLGVAVVLMSAASCSGANVPRVADACSLLTREEVATAVQATSQPGLLTSSYGESKKRLCSFQVSGQLGTVLVYLGDGTAPPNTDLYRATEVRGDTYVIVFAQNVDKSFPEAAATLAQIAIHRASRQ